MSKPRRMAWPGQSRPGGPKLGAALGTSCRWSEPPEDQWPNHCGWRFSTIGAALGLPTSRVVLAVAGGVLLGALQVATRT